MISNIYKFDELETRIIKEKEQKQINKRKNIQLKQILKYKEN